MKGLRTSPSMEAHTPETFRSRSESPGCRAICIEGGGPAPAKIGEFRRRTLPSRELDAHHPGRRAGTKEAVPEVCSGKIAIRMGIEFWEVLSRSEPRQQMNAPVRSASQAR